MAGHACNTNTWEVEAGRGKFKPAWTHRARPCLTGSSQWWCWMDGSGSRAVDWISGDQCCCSVWESHFLTLRPVSKVSTLECVFHPQTFPAEWIADREWGSQGIGAGWQVVLGSLCPSVLETFLSIRSLLSLWLKTAWSCPVRPKLLMWLSILAWWAGALVSFRGSHSDGLIPSWPY